ncbi:MAG: ORF6N domain-containing protein [Thermodesulfobacteriota bacterium]
MPEKMIMIPEERIENTILLIRGQKVILDADLAILYNVPTKALNQAVKRNLKRFPADFMFQLTLQEKKELVTICDRFRRLKHSSVLPRAFTEQGVAMLSTVLNSERAIEVNIEIMRTFVRLRQMLLSHTELARKIEQMEKKYDEQFRVVFEAIRQLMAPPAKPKRKIGFLLKEKQAGYGKMKGKSVMGGNK